MNALLDVAVMLSTTRRSAADALTTTKEYHDLNMTGYGRLMTDYNFRLMYLIFRDNRSPTLSVGWLFSLYPAAR